MGLLVLKDTGSTSIRTSSGLFEADNVSSEGILNPSGSQYPNNFGCIDLKAFTLSYTTGKTVDDTANIAGTITRLGLGSTNPIPITLSARFSRKRIEEASANSGGTQYTMDDANTISFLTAWSRRRTILMLFWMPNSDDSSLLSYGQERDFFTSKVRSLYDVLWDLNLSNATTGWHDSTYGSFHYEVTMTNIGSYQAAAIPIVLTSVTNSELADSFWIDVTVEGFALENEE